MVSKKNSKSDSMYISIEFEDLLSYLFGESHYHGFTGHHNIGVWKKTILKIFDLLQKTIKVNLDTTDLSHKKRFQELFNSAIRNIKKASKKDEINRLCIQYLLQITFLLQGGEFNNWERKVIQKQYLKLDKCRKINFTQTNNHRINILLDYFADKKEMYKNLFEDLCAKSKESGNKAHYWNRIPIDFGNEKTEIWKINFFLYHILKIDFHNDSYEFLIWLKENYPDIYIDISLMII